MVLTDGDTARTYLATLEQENKETEEKYFSKLADIAKPMSFDQEVENEVVDKVPATNTQTVIGAGLLLKVMAGDKINAAVFAKYNKNNINTNPVDNNSIVQQLKDAMLSGFAKQLGSHSAEFINKFSSENWVESISHFLETKNQEVKNAEIH